MRKIKLTGFVLFTTALSFWSCSEDIEEKTPITKNVETSYVIDNVTKMASLTPVNGQLAEFLTEDEYFKTETLDFNAVPNDVNAIYINADALSNEVLQKFKETTLYQNIKKNNLAIIIDSYASSTTSNVEHVTRQLFEGSSINSKSLIAFNEGPITLIPFHDHRKTIDAHITNSLFVIKGYFSEEIDNLSDDEWKIREAKYNEQVALIQKSNSTTNDEEIEEDNTNDLFSNAKINNTINTTINNSNIIQANFDFDAIVSNDDNEKCKFEFTPIGSSRRTTQGISENQIVRRNVIKAYGNIVHGPASSGISQSTSITYGWSVGFSMGLKLVPRKEGKLFGMLLKEIAPAISQNYSVSFTKTLGANTTVSIPTGKFGYMAEMKDYANANGYTQVSNARISYRKLEWNNGCECDWWYNYNRNYNFNGENRYNWSDSKHPVYANQPWLNSTYYAAYIW